MHPEFAAVQQVSSGQQGTHTNLNRTVTRHLQHTYQRVPTTNMQQVFKTLYDALKDRPIILDTGCGRGHSTRLLAQRFPEHYVLGLDKSEVRLSHLSEPLPDNCQLARVELVDFWLLAQQHHWIFEQVYLYYPNPWPKLAHLKRRWHGHPVFKALLETAKALELRTNWQIYAEEFAASLQLAGLDAKSESLLLDADSTFVSAFERKYVLSGQTVYAVKSAGLAK